MSTFDFDALLPEAVLNEESVIAAVKKSFDCDVRVNERFDSTVYMEVYKEEKFKFGVYLVNSHEGKIWDSDILRDEYHYRQYMSIALLKEQSDMDTVYSIIKFYLDLAKKDDLKMLVKSITYNDICYINKDEIRWNKNFYEAYSEYFH